MQPPDVRYARSGDVAIAYQVVGEGPSTLCSSEESLGICSRPGSSRSSSATSRVWRRCGRVLMLDKRGTGLSDRVREVQSLETTMDDIRAVMDAAGSDRAVIFTGSTSTGIGVLFAATYPDRCAGLVLIDPRVKGTRATDYPWAPTEDEWREQLAAVRAGWGERGYLEGLAHEWAPEVADDDAFRDWFVWHMRRSLSPGAALTSFRTAMELDVRDVLAAVRVPTLVFPRPALPGPGHYTADRIRGAEVVELPSFRGVYTWVDDDAHRTTMEAIAPLRLPPDRSCRDGACAGDDPLHGHRRLDGARGAAWRLRLEGAAPTTSRDRPPRAGPLPGQGTGHRWRWLLRGVRRAGSRSPRGRRAISDPLGESRSIIRAGLHTGECEVNDGKIAGIAVAIGARIASLARPGEVLVSRTVKDLVAGSGLRFEDRGEQPLKGIAEPWHVFSVTR